MKRILLSLLLFAGVIQVCMAQYDYVVKLDSYRFKPRTNVPVDTIRRPATLSISREGTIRLELSGKSTYTIPFDEVKVESDTGWFIILISWTNLKFYKNGKEMAEISDNGEFTARATDYPYINMRNPQLKDLFNTIKPLIEKKAFFVKRQPKPQTQAPTNAVSSNTMICIYDGGYFIRDGNKWYEYRPKQKPNDVWAYYDQYHEENGFFNIKSSACSVSVPKAANNNVFIAKNNKWEVVYYTKQVFNYCPERGNKLFCHTRGFFFKTGDQWREYLPGSKSTGVWASYTETGHDDGFYYIKNNTNEVAVPRKAANKFFVRKTPSDAWSEVYTTTQVFDY